MGINAIFPVQFFGSALLSHSAVGQDYDLIGSCDSTHPVGNDENRLVLHQTGDRFLHCSLILYIQGGGGLMFIYTNPGKPHKH